MRLYELMEQLEDLANSLSPDADPEVFLATHPNWPFENTISAVILQNEVQPASQADVDLLLEALEPESLDEEQKERVAEILGRTRWNVADAEEWCEAYVDHSDYTPLESQDAVFIGEGSQVGYLRTSVKQQLGW